jgi:hypothetical protein
MALTQVKAAGLTADLIDETKLADDSIDSEHYNDGSIDHAHLSNDCVDADNIDDNAVGLAAMAHGTDGVIITYDASGAPIHVGPGSDGQVLTSTGAGSPPAFETIAAGGGKILQVKRAVKTNTFSTDATSFTAVTDLSISITPASTDNFILIWACLNGNTNGSKGAGRLVRDSTAIGVGDAASSRIQGSFDFHNAGSGNRGINVNSMWVEQAQNTNATTYKVEVRHENGSGSLYLGRTESDSDGASATRTSNSLVVMEFSV